MSFLILFFLFLSLDGLNHSSVISLILYSENQNLLLNTFNEFLIFTINKEFPSHLPHQTLGSLLYG